MFDDGYEQVVSRIMYNVHALEKGLARNSDLRLGFGSKALSNLNDTLVVYRTKGYDRSAFAYVQGLSVIQRYKELHAKEQFDVSFLADIVDPEFLDPQADFGGGGHQVGEAGRQGAQLREDFLRLGPGSK